MRVILTVTEYTNVIVFLRLLNHKTVLGVVSLFTFQVWFGSVVDGRSPPEASSGCGHGVYVSDSSEAGIHRSGRNVFR